MHELNRRELHDPFNRDSSRNASIDAEVKQFRGFGKYKPNETLMSDSEEVNRKLFMNTTIDEDHRATIGTRTYKGKEALSRFYVKY